MGAPPLLFIEEDKACSDAQMAPKHSGLQQVTNGEVPRRTTLFIPKC
jgi:hypothetical protein